MGHGKAGAEKSLAATLNELDAAEKESVQLRNSKSGGPVRFPPWRGRRGVISQILKKKF